MNRRSDFLGNFHWTITNRCNYNCEYCFVDRTPVSLVIRDDIIPEGWDVIITGGEPFTVPDFVNLCTRISKRGHYIALDTNLSHMEDMCRLLDNIGNENIIYVYIGLHIDEIQKRGSIKDFCKNVRFLKKLVPLHLNYVFYPPRFKIVDEHLRLFKEEGLELYITSFAGNFGNKTYPRDYEPEERSRISNSGSLSPFISNGLMCSAGCRSVCANPDGTVMRCRSDTSPINIVDGKLMIASSAQPCRVNVCLCLGEYLVEECTREDIQKRSLI